MQKYSGFTGAVFAVMAALLSLSAAAAGTIAAEHVSGRTEVPANPKKVVVFDLASLDNLTRLGVTAVVGVPQTPLPAYLSRYSEKRYARVGTLFEPDYEAIARLAPDLVVVAGRSQPKYTELSRMAPTIDLTVRNNHYLDDVARNVTLLGRIFSREEQAIAEIAGLRQSIDTLEKQAADKGTGLLIMTTGGRISAYGPGSRFGLLHDAFGIVPAAPGLSTGQHGQPVSPEFILETDPDWLFVIDRDAAIGATGKSARQLLDNAIVNRTKAAAKGQKVYLDPQNWYLVGGGLSGLHETIDQISRAFRDSESREK